jgi:hypothetical protein
MSQSKSFGLRLLSTGHSLQPAHHFTPMKKNLSTTTSAAPPFSRSSSLPESSDDDQNELSIEEEIQQLKKKNAQKKQTDHDLKGSNESKQPMLNTTKSMAYKLREGNEEVEIMVESGLLSKGKKKKQQKAGKEKWKQGDIDRRKVRLSIVFFPFFHCNVTNTNSSVHICLFNVCFTTLATYRKKQV